MKQYSIFGNPVEHSISPKMHNSAFKKFGINAHYSKYKLENTVNLKKIFYELNLDGANITVPHKEVAYESCDKIKGIAQQIKAINTIIKKDNELIGYNTDAPGFIMAIEEFLPLKSALILGAGGTAKAIACALKHEGLQVSVVNRSQKRLESIKDLDIMTYTWDTFRKGSFDIIINTTSAGLNDNLLPLPKKLLLSTIKDIQFAFDVIYHKKTPFLDICTQNNLTCKDGKDMLLYQGVLAFNLFFDNTFNKKEIIHVMQKTFIN